MHKLEDAHPKIKRLECLYKNYQPQTYDFEVFETLRKLMLTGVVFLKPGTESQICMAMLKVPHSHASLCRQETLNCGMCPLSLTCRSCSVPTLRRTRVVDCSLVDEG